MRNLSSISLVMALLLSASGNVSATEVMRAEDAPSQERMNYLVGKKVIRLKAIPEQLDENCRTVEDVRDFNQSCRPAINALANSSSYTPEVCDLVEQLHAEKRSKMTAVNCTGSIQTEIGSGRVVVTFRKPRGKWLLLKEDVVLDLWESK